MLKLFPVLLFCFGTIFLCRCTVPTQNSESNEKITDDASEVKNDTAHLLYQYWELTDAEHPMTKDVSHDENGVSLEPGIVFMTDNTVLENPAGQMSYGKFSLNGNTINVDFDNGQKATYTILRLRKDELRLRRKQKKDATELFYTGTSTYWPDAKTNPFSKENYKWAIKPLKPETDDEIKQRVKDYLRFYSYYLTGYTNGKATKIEFKSLPCCFNWYWGGIGIQNENKLDKKWEACFYSLDEAYKGRQMIEDVVQKKYHWDEKEKDWVKQSTPILMEIRDSL